VKAHRPNRSKLQRLIKRRDKQRRNWCRRCRFLAPSGRCLDPTIRNGRCGDWVYYLLPGNKQCRRRWVRPKDPRTPAQRQNRARLAAASHKYSALLTNRQQAACIAAGAKRQSRPRLGQSGPLTGQQYSVRKQYAATVQAEVQSTRIPAKVPRPQRLTRPTWGKHRGNTGMPPEQHRSTRRLSGPKRKAVAALEVHKRYRVTRSTKARYRSEAPAMPQQPVSSRVTLRSGRAKRKVAARSRSVVSVTRPWMAI
jgi:hypothetical protein